MKVVINTCYGGFGLSDAAYEKLIEWGVPVRKYQQEPRNPVTGLVERVPENEGEVIFDRDLDDPIENDELAERCRQSVRQLGGRYWDSWIDRSNRHHPLLVRVVEELGAGHHTGASGEYADLKVVEIPDGIDYAIEEYDGIEHIAEVHRTWH